MNATELHLEGGKSMEKIADYSVVSIDPGGEKESER
jgi:hypothetical protein